MTVVSGIYCDNLGTQFSSSVYDAVIDERTTGSILSVNLINGSDYTMSITWSDPEEMKGFEILDYIYLILILKILSIFFF